MGKKIGGMLFSPKSPLLPCTNRVTTIFCFCTQSNCHNHRSASLLQATFRTQSTQHKSRISMKLQVNFHNLTQQCNCMHHNQIHFTTFTILTFRSVCMYKKVVYTYSQLSSIQFFSALFSLFSTCL